MADSEGGVRGHHGRTAGAARPRAAARPRRRKAQGLNPVLRQSATASAPASIGNVGVGFFILGQAFDAARDVVTAVRAEKPGVRLMQVSGLVSCLPAAPQKNTALASSEAVLRGAGAQS